MLALLSISILPVCIEEVCVYRKYEGRQISNLVDFLEDVLKMDSFRNLCKRFTNFTDSDISVLEQVALSLQNVAELTGNDIFIDALTPNGREAIVLAWAKPSHASIYSTSVVGELVYQNNEPAVYHSLTTGEVKRDIRGVSQEGVPIAQTVVPISNAAGEVIGVLIMERNISKDLQQEERVEFLSFSVEKLSSTLMSLSLTENNFEEWVGNGIFVLNKQGKITYANKHASRIFEECCQEDALGSNFFALLPNCHSVNEVLEYLKDSLEIIIGENCYRFQAYPLIFQSQLSGCAISVVDQTELKKKEQELNTQSMIIREIHHRVKNNLHNIAAVLRLQMRRSQSETVKSEFAASINRITSIALVHEIFALESWDAINFNEFCKRILPLLVESSGLSLSDVVTRVEGPDIRLPSRKAIPLALVINELVTNSIKHGIKKAGSGEISICFKESNGMISLLVSDSGEDSNKRFLHVPQKGLGMQIVESLVQEELEGFFRFERIDGVTRALVCFSRNSKEDSK